MKFLKPMGISRIAKPTSFGQKRAMQMEQALSKVTLERKNLLKKEFASPDPLNKIYQQKGQQLDAQIRKLKDETHK
ncbi:hypothetical protein KA017_00890 [Candidatus Woesebacteria bacterium]|nr:hypothetical protein [Candidatus Woesebacteria bacterium]